VIFIQKVVTKSNDILSIENRNKIARFAIYKGFEHFLNVL